MKKHRLKEAGLSLVEIIIYISILSSLMLGLTSFSLSLRANQTRTTTLDSILDNVDFINKEFDNIFYNELSDISVPLENNASTSLEGVLKNISNLYIFLDNEDLIMRYNDENNILNFSKLKINNLNFTYHVEGEARLIKISFTIENRFGDSREFQSRYNYIRTYKLNEHE